MGLGGRDKIKTVLIVEDNLDHVDLISISLRRSFSNAKIIHASNGQEAIEILGLSETFRKSGIKPDLIFLDVNLPKLPGIEILQRIRSNPVYNQIPVIAISTSARNEEIENMLTWGANAYFIKTEKIDLGEKVKSLLFKDEMVFC